MSTTMYMNPVTSVTMNPPLIPSAPVEQTISPHADAQSLDLLEIATTRWLHADEIERLLTPETCPLVISEDRPSSPPPSGTVLLYDRTTVRKYKDDGHVWVKKRGHANKVREDHVKLRLNGKEVVTGTYVHSAERDTMHRRAYRLLEGPDEAPSVQRRKQNWVLVHYLDAAEAARISSEKAFQRCEAGRRQAEQARAREAYRVGGVTRQEWEPRMPKRLSCSSDEEERRSSSYSDSRPPTPKSSGEESAWGYQQSSPSPLPQQQQQQHPWNSYEGYPSNAQVDHASYSASSLTTAYASPAAINDVSGAHTFSPAPAPPPPPPPSPQQYYSYPQQHQYSEHPPQQHQYSEHPPQQQHQQQRSSSLNSKGGRTYSYSSENFPDFQHAANSKRHRKQESSLDDTTMGILWNMISQCEPSKTADAAKIAAVAALQDSGLDDLVEEELVGAVKSALQAVEVKGTISDADSESSESTPLSSGDVGSLPRSFIDHVRMVSDTDIVSAIEQVLKEPRPKSFSNLETLTELKEEEGYASGTSPSAPSEAKIPPRNRRQSWIEQQRAGENSDISGGSDGHSHHDSFVRFDSIADGFSMDEIKEEAMNDSSSFDKNSNHESSCERIEDTFEPRKDEIVTDTVPSASVSPTIDGLPRTPLPDIIDFTPNEACIDSSNDMNVHIVISTSAPVPELPPDDTLCVWQYLVAFIDEDGAMQADGSSIKVSAIVPATFVTSFSYKCDVPLGAFSTGGGRRRLVMVGARLFSRGGKSLETGRPIWNAIRAAVELTLRAEWRKASAKDEASEGDMPLEDGGNGTGTMSSSSNGPTFYAPAGGKNVQILSQFSLDSFRFRAAKRARHHTDSARKRRADSFAWPAPAAAMASVANAIGGTNLCSPDAKPSPSLLPPSDHSVDTMDECGHSIASAGFNSVDSVDRRCRLQMVEHLANTTVAAEGLKTEKEVQDTMTDGNFGYTDHEAAPSIAFTTDEISSMSDDELGSLVDGAIIRFVETLLDACGDEGDDHTGTVSNRLRQLLDAAGGNSGFALLHYAALYNMSALIPLLLSRGANPDKRTSNGGLTALHLAAGAGHANIVSLLVRNGCDAAALDGSGLTAADHAARNGFEEMADWIAREAEAEAAARGGSSEKSGDFPGRGKVICRTSKKKIVTDSGTSGGVGAIDGTNELLRSALRGMSLEKYLGPDLLARLSKHLDAAEENSAKMSDDEDADEANPRDELKDQNAVLEGINSTLGLTTSEENKEKLGLAFSLMSDKDRSDIEKLTSYSSVTKWMLQSNYASLEEASAQLEREMRMHRESITPGSNTDENFSANTAKLSHALMMLVLRKKLLTKKKESK